MIHIKIRAVALSKANSLVNLTTILPTKDGLLKLQVNFRDIQTIFGAISPEFQHNDTRFNVCIFKRPIEAKGKIEQDAVWFYLCCRSEPDQRLKWAYRIILMTKNDDIAPLTAYYEDIVFSKEKDSCGAPFVLLSELNNTRNQYVLASGAMTIELSLSATRNTQPLRKKISGLTQRYIKTEPQSPQIYSDPLNNQQLLPNANIKQERCDSPPLICVRETPCVTPSSEPSTSNSSGGQAIGHSEEDIATLKCILCSNSLFDDDVYATKCGHLYCQGTYKNIHHKFPCSFRLKRLSNLFVYYSDCFRKDIMYRKMCLKCDVFFTKIQCRKVYLNAEHEKNCRFKHIATRSDSLASSFADTVTQEAEIQHLNCPLCDINLLTVETSVTLCGHLYCKKCLDTDIGKRGMCIVCNKKDSYDWTPINFP